MIGDTLVIRSPLIERNGISIENKNEHVLERLRRMNYFLAIDVGGTKIIASIFKERELLRTLSGDSDPKDTQIMYESLMGTVTEFLTTSNVKRE